MNNALEYMKRRAEIQIISLDYYFKQLVYRYRLKFTLTTFLRENMPKDILHKEFKQYLYSRKTNISEIAKEIVNLATTYNVIDNLSDALEECCKFILTDDRKNNFLTLRQYQNLCVNWYLKF